MNTTNEYVKPANGSIKKLTETTSKRGIPNLSIEALFYLVDAEAEGYKPFYKEVFADYYNYLTGKFRSNLRSLFEHINGNVPIVCEFKYHSMVLYPRNDITKRLKLPHNNFFKHFFKQYADSEISCSVTLDEILYFINK